MKTQTPSERMRELGITLPSAPEPLASYVPVRIHAGTATVSGQLPFDSGELCVTGAVPSNVSAAKAKAAARLCAINALAAVAEAVGSVDRIAGVIKLGAFVTSDPGFGGQPAIANGASDLLFEIFGEPGRHARAAVGVAALPLDAAVEIEFIFALHPES